MRRAALRRNRTLTALRWDGNGIMLDGLRAFRGCLYGNKKLVEVPFANRDMAAILQKASQLFLDSLNQEYDARVLLKRSYAGRKGRYEPTVRRERAVVGCITMDCWDVKIRD